MLWLLHSWGVAELKAKDTEHSYTLYTDSGSQVISKLAPPFYCFIGVVNLCGVYCFQALERFCRNHRLHLQGLGINVLIPYSVCL